MLRTARFLVPFLVLCACSRAHHPDAAPLSPEQALASFRLDERFRIELFAAEPHVVDPVEVAFDENGRAYVAEMRDYPDDPPPGKPHRSLIRLLEDSDGDGRVDRSSIFAEGLLQATSVLPWQGGVIVCAAPDILYLKDNDGDGRADVRRTLFTGFALVNAESRITNLRFGVDNWIYASNNGQPGSIRFLDRADAPPLNVIGADFRFRLDRGLFEAESGPTQFGQGLDEWGRRFITENTTHVRNVVLPRRYLNRNPFLAAGEAAQDVSDHGRPSARMFPLTGPQKWRRERTRMRQERYRENDLEKVRPLNPSTEIVGGYFSGAAGGTVYTGDTFAPEFRGNLFTGDVSGNLVHRDLLRPDGVSFAASRAPGEAEREFLASTDPWFRPCNFATGPDGNLYVTDIYREFIETPESIPEEIKKDMDFWSGDTMGRIYRIAPKTAASKAPRPALGAAPTAELVRLLAHPNAWWRLTAQRLLLERRDRSAVEPLRETARAGTTPLARLHALYALEGFEALEEADVAAALAAGEAELREHAVRLAERFPGLAGRVIGMASDPAPRVRLQVALSAGDFVGADAAALREPAVRALAGLAVTDGTDRWFRTAILSAPPAAALPLLRALLADAKFFGDPGAGRVRLLEDLTAVVGARAEASEVGEVLTLTARSPKLGAEAWQVAAYTGLGRGLKLAGVSRLTVGTAAPLIERALTAGPEPVQAAALTAARHLDLPGFLAAARKGAVDRTLASARRQRAIHSLASGGFAEVRSVLAAVLDSEQDPDLVGAAIQALGAFDDPGVAELVVAHWKPFGPAARNAALGVLLDRPNRIPAVLDAVESGRIEAAAFDLARKEKLLESPDSETSRRARKIFGAVEGDRARIVEEFRRSVAEAGDAVRGRPVFEKTCAVCHMPRRGRRIGPDLSGVSSRTRAQLLEDILNPSRAVQPRFTNYLVSTRDGRMLDGLIAGETPGTLTLRRSEGDDEVLLRTNVVSVRASSLSLMPDGLEVGISKQDLADLIAYLQGANLGK